MAFAGAQCPSLHYSAGYNIGLLGLEKLHPFDANRSRRALRVLGERIGRRALSRHLTPVTREAREDDLILVHSAAYLASVSQSRTIAQVLEVAAVERLPDWLSNRWLGRPMRLAVQGTIEAARSALKTGLAVNLAGGFHHASHDRGGGFCMYSDAIIAVRALQRDQLLGNSIGVLYIDLDAHQGNGVARACAQLDMTEVYIFDMYCRDIYPGDDVAADRIDLAVPLQMGTGDHFYLEALRQLLPRAITQSRASLAIYNAGTDVLAGDPLGGLNVSGNGVMERDRYVIESCRAAGIPLLVLPSGGYTHTSHKLIAAMLVHAVERYATAKI